LLVLAGDAKFVGQVIHGLFVTVVCVDPAGCIALRYAITKHHLTHLPLGLPIAVTDHGPLAFDDAGLIAGLQLGLVHPEDKQPKEYAE
jgi:hypothetical protein